MASAPGQPIMPTAKPTRRNSTAPRILSCGGGVTGDAASVERVCRRAAITRQTRVCARAHQARDVAAVERRQVVVALDLGRAVAREKVLVHLCSRGRRTNEPAAPRQSDWRLRDKDGVCSLTGDVWRCRSLADGRCCRQRRYLALRAPCGASGT
eukprot:6420833-Prymnesium_polylepis.2